MQRAIDSARVSVAEIGAESRCSKGDWKCSCFYVQTRPVYALKNSEKNSLSFKIQRL